MRYNKIISEPKVQVPIKYTLEGLQRVMPRRLYKYYFFLFFTDADLITTSIFLGKLARNVTTAKKEVLEIIRQFGTEEAIEQAETILKLKQRRTSNKEIKRVDRKCRTIKKVFVSRKEAEALLNRTKPN